MRAGPIPRRKRASSHAKPSSCSSACRFRSTAICRASSVKVKLPNGTELADSSIVVEDVLVVAMGDSFASGESNPDRPVTFSATRQMVYDPVNLQANQNLASRGNADYHVASAEDQFNPKALPKRLMADEMKDLVYDPNTPEFLGRFREGARAVAEPGLPPLAIRLSVPRQHGDGARGSAPRRHFRQPGMLRRRYRRRLVHAERRAR